MDSFWIAAAIASPMLVFVGFVVAGASRAVYRASHPAGTPCTPHRYASMTASAPQQPPVRRRVTMPLGAHYIVPRPCDVDAIRENSYSYDLAALTAPAEPELPRVVPVTPVVEQEHGIAVDWPTQVVQPVPLTRL